MPFLYMGGLQSAADGMTTRRRDLDTGEYVWSANHTATVYGIASDDTGVVVTGGDPTGSPLYTTRKYDADGNLLWSVNHGARVYAVAMDAAGNVYTAGHYESTSGNWYTVRKYNPSGVLQWSASPGGGYQLYAISVTSDGSKVLVGGLKAGGYDTAWELSGSDGSETWSVDTDANVYAVEIDSAGRRYVAGAASGGTTTRVFTSSGEVSWSANHGTDVLSIAVDAEGNVYTGGGNVDEGGVVKNVRKYSSAGSLQWSATHGNDVNGIAVDFQGNIYAGGTAAGSPSKTDRKYDSSGDVVWSNYHGNQLRAVAVSGTTPVGPSALYGLSTLETSSVGVLEASSTNIWLRVNNWARTALSDPMTASATQMSLLDGRFGTGAAMRVPFRAVIWTGSQPYNSTTHEIVHVTAVGGNVATIVRGMEGTTAVPHAVGSHVASMATGGVIDQIQFAIDRDYQRINVHNQLSGLQGGTAGQYNHLTDAQVALIGAVGSKLPNLVMAGPASGEAAAPTWRRLVTADVPTVLLVSTINGVNVVAPATAANLVLINGVTLTVSASATVSGANTGDLTLVATNNGLTLTNQVLGMGTPLTVTSSSTNTVIGSGHNHALAFSVPTATAATLGLVKVGTRLTIVDGVLSADEQSSIVPTASDTVLGGVKIGTTLTIADGVANIVETDPVFTAWDKDYADLSNRPTLGSAAAEDATAFEAAGAVSTHAAVKTVHGLVNAGGDTLTVSGAATISGTNTGDQTLESLGGVPTSRTLTINGTGLELSADRIVTLSHTALSDIGTLGHTTIDSYLDQSVKVAAAPQFARVGLGVAADANRVFYSSASLATSLPLYERTGGITNEPIASVYFLSTKTTDMGDGFGVTQAFQIQDNAGVKNTIGTIGFVRDGADNSGAFVVKPYTAGTANEMFRIAANGDTTASGTLKVTGHGAYGGGAVATNTVLSVSKTFTGTDAANYTQIGHMADVTYAPTVALTAQHYTIGGNYTVRWNSDIDGGGGTGSDLRAFMGAASISGTASGNLKTAIGSWGLVQHLGSGTLWNAYGVRGWVDNNALSNHTGTIDKAYCIYSECSTNKNTGLINSRYGLYVADKSGAGTVTNQYGVYIENIDGGVNNYSIYSAGGANHLAGSLSAASYAVGAVAGIDATVVLAKVTAGGANGNFVVTKGIITGYTAPT